MSNGICIRARKDQISPLLSETPHQCDTRLSKRQGNRQHFLKVSFVKQLKNQTTHLKNEIGVNFGNDFLLALICYKRPVLTRYA